MTSKQSTMSLMVHFMASWGLLGLYYLAFSLFNAAYSSISRNTDIRELPSIVPPEYANRTAQIIDMELSSRIKRLEEILNDGNVDVGVATNGG